MLHDDILKFMNDARVFRRVTLMTVLWMTYKTFTWGADLATAWMATNKPGLEMAAVLGAVLAPVSYAIKAVFDTYTREVK